MSDIYFVKRHGGWFRPKAAGYTDDLAAAGQYTKAEAERYLHAEGVTIHPASELRAQIVAERDKSGERLAALNTLLMELV